jgi:hypothetical protein
LAIVYARENEHEGTSIDTFFITPHPIRSITRASRAHLSTLVIYSSGHAWNGTMVGVRTQVKSHNQTHNGIVVFSATLQPDQVCVVHGNTFTDIRKRA